MLSDTLLDAAEEIKSDLEERCEGMYLPWQREKVRSLAAEMIALGHEIGAHPARWNLSDPNKVSPAQAQQILDEHTNGTISAISINKGGRVWLDGEFQLCHLEALCVKIRAEAGVAAHGAIELIQNWRKDGMLDEQHEKAEEE